MTSNKAKGPAPSGPDAQTQHHQDQDTADDKRPPPPPPPFTIIPTNVLCDGALLESDLRVLGALCSFLNRKTFQCNPRQKWIALRAGVSRSCARTALKRLRNMGYIDWEQHFRSDGGKGVNHYSILSFAEPFDYYGMPTPIPDTDLPMVTDADHTPVTDADQGMVTHADQPLVVVGDQQEQTKEQIIEQTSSTPRIAPKRDVARVFNNSNGKGPTQLLTEAQKQKGPAYDAS